MSKLLLELLKVSRISDEEDVPKAPEESEGDDLEDDTNPDAELDMDTELGGEEPVEGGEEGDDEFSDFDDLLPDEEGELDDEGMPPEEGEGDPEQQGDPNRAGVIRHVKGAHLVYKREQEDGTYEEMWMYNSGEFKKDIETKQAILAGTDIPKNATQSPDGAQEVSMWSAGNVDIVKITGLPQ